MERGSINRIVRKFRRRVGMLNEPVTLPYMAHSYLFWCVVVTGIIAAPYCMVPFTHCNWYNSFSIPSKVLKQCPFSTHMHFIIVHICNVMYSFRENASCLIFVSSVALATHSIEWAALMQCTSMNDITCPIATHQNSIV